MTNEFGLIGKTITEIKGATDGSDVIEFKFSDGEKYEMYHQQDCCESVYLQDIIGDINDLLNSPLTMCEETTSNEELGIGDESDSFTWTFYKFATIKGYVTLRWLGSSNGYYSESVTFEKKRS